MAKNVVKEMTVGIALTKVYKQRFDPLLTFTWEAFLDFDLVFFPKLLCI